MAIVIVGMLDEREEALRLIRDRIRQRGHETFLIDISVGSGAIVPTLEADVTPVELADLAEGSAGRRGRARRPGDRGRDGRSQGQDPRAAGARRRPGHHRHHRDDRRADISAGHDGVAVRNPQDPHLGGHHPAGSRGHLWRLLRPQGHHRDALRGRHRGDEPPGPCPCPERRRCHLRHGGGRPGLTRGGQAVRRGDRVRLLSTKAPTI